MANMSYCRFQNTRYDLRDCLDAFQEAKLNGSTEDQLSTDEGRALLEMIEIMQEFMDELNDNAEGFETEDMNDMETLKKAHPYLFRGEDEEE